MNKLQTQMKAVVVSTPRLHNINDEELLAYEAEMQYVRKKPKVKYILCTPIDDVCIGDRVNVKYAVHKRAYQHEYQSLSNSSNSYGEFYYTNGKRA